jgi:hypothetical protein
MIAFKVAENFRIVYFNHDDEVCVFTKFHTNFFVIFFVEFGSTRLVENRFNISAIFFIGYSASQYFSYKLWQNLCSRQIK